MNAVDDVAPWKYNKLLSNLGNAVGALSAEGADFSALMAALRAEGEQVLRSAGIEFVSFEVSTAARAERSDAAGGARARHRSEQLDLAVAEPQHRQRGDRFLQR